MAKSNVYNEDEHKLHVMSDRCSTCIFRPGNLMMLEPGRVAEMVREAKANESVIPCHQTILGQRDQQAVCNGYFEAHGSAVASIRLAVAMGIIQYDAPSEKEFDDA